MFADKVIELVSDSDLNSFTRRDSTSNILWKVQAVDSNPGLSEFWLNQQQ